MPCLSPSLSVVFCCACCCCCCWFRILLQVLAVLAGVGCLIMVDFPILPFAYSEAQYVTGVSLVFVALQAHEGVIMSITSKIIPVKLAR